MTALLDELASALRDAQRPTPQPTQDMLDKLRGERDGIKRGIELTYRFEMLYADALLQPSLTDFATVFDTSIRESFTVSEMAQLIQHLDVLRALIPMTIQNVKIMLLQKAAAGGA